MKLLATTILALFLVFLTTQIYGYWQQGKIAERDLQLANEELMAVEKSRAELEGDYNYYANEHNAEKELRSRFNYRNPDETMAVVVPMQPTTTSPR